MLDGNTINKFDEDGIFRPLVAGYLAELHGHLELSTRHAIEDRDFAAEHLMMELGVQWSQKKIDRFNSGHTTPLIQPLQPLIEVENTSIDIAHKSLRKAFYEITKDDLYSVSTKSAGSLLVMATERIKPFYENGDIPEGPILDFLRYCRNGIAHGGEFSFRGDEPTSEARWRGIELESGMHGEKIFVDGSGEGYLSLGDPILLLHDIEDKYGETFSS